MTAHHHQGRPHRIRSTPTPVDPDTVDTVGTPPPPPPVPAVPDTVTTNRRPVTVPGGGPVTDTALAALDLAVAAARWATNADARDNYQAAVRVARAAAERDNPDDPSKVMKLLGPDLAAHRMSVSIGNVTRAAGTGAAFLTTLAVLPPARTATGFAWDAFWWRPTMSCVALAALILWRTAARRRDTPTAPTPEVQYSEVGIPEPDRPTAPVLAAALAELDIPRLKETFRKAGNPADAVTWFQEPAITRDLAGERIGWHTTFRLPRGVTVDELGSHLDRLAGLTGRHESTVHIRRMKRGTPSDVDILLLDRPMSDTVRAWGPPPRANVFAPVTIGHQADGTPVTFHMFTDRGSTNLLVGGKMGSGKSNVSRLLAGTAALDPDTELWIINAKDGVDFDGLRDVADVFCVSADVRHVAYEMLRRMTNLQAEVEARGGRLRKARDSGLSNATKVTETVARARIGLHPIVVVLEEFQRVFGFVDYDADKKDQRVGDRVTEIVRDIVTIGRAFGVFIVFATQKPSSKIMDTDLRDSIQAGLGFRLRAEGLKMVLGDAAAGLSTEGFGTGTGILSPEIGDPVTLQAIYAEDEPVDVLVEVGRRGVELRRQLGLLPPDGDDEVPPDTVHLVELSVAAAGGEDPIPVRVMAERLARLDPTRFDGQAAEPGQVTAALNAAAARLGVEFTTPDGSIARLARVTIDGKSTPTRSYALADLLRMQQAIINTRTAVTRNSTVTGGCYTLPPGPAVDDVNDD